MKEDIIYDSPDMQLLAIVGGNATTPLDEQREGSSKDLGGDTGMTVPSPDPDENIPF